jgi:hypothetical protein
MKVRRREFIGAVGGALASVSAPVVNSTAQALEMSSQATQPTPTVETSYTVSGGGIAVEISSRGEIVGVSLTGKKIHRALQGHSALSDSQLNGQMTSAKLPDGGVEFRKPLSFQRGFRAASLVERFLPTPYSVRWEVDVECGATRLPWPPFTQMEPWSTAIETHLKWPEAKSAKFWTAWGDNFSSKIVENMDSSGMAWIDPTVPQPFREMQLFYGSYYFAGPAFSVPIATIIEEANDSGVSLALSPEDALLDVRLKTDGEGSITFSRLDNRISKEKPVRFAMDLIAHDGDWRAAMAWMVKRYPDYFNPPNPKTYEIAGTAAYSAFTGELDANKFKKMAYRVNWLASFDFPWYGMYLPPVAEDTEWMSLYGRGLTSKRKMNDYCRRMREVGFHVLCYFNTTDMGYMIEFPPRPLSSLDESRPLWTDPNAFVYTKLASSIVYREDGQPLRGGDGTVIMDPGDPACQNFILEQVTRHARELPYASGICVDQIQWLPHFNYRADDGVTWVNTEVGHLKGVSARAMITSYKDILVKIGPIMHSADKVLYVNTQIRRLDLMREVDGIFDEFGYDGFNLNQDSFIGVLKPVIVWTFDKAQLQPDPDAFFQRHLFLGAFPMVPYPENDHSILPDEWAERFYMDYGPLLDELRGRKWVLKPHVIEVEGSAAKANIFQTPRGFAAPVTFGGQAESVAVMVRGLPPVASPQDYQIETLLPGSSEWNAVKFRKVAGGLAITVPLSRGCAMVRFVQT